MVLELKVSGREKYLCKESKYQAFLKLLSLIPNEWKHCASLFFFYQGELLSHMKVPGSKASSDSHSNNNKKPTCTEACINLYALNWMYLKVKNKTKKEPLTFSALCTEFPLKFLLIITLLYWMRYCLWHITWFSLLTFLLIVRIETANPKTGLNFEIWQNRGFFHILNGELHTITEQNYLCMSWLK